MGLVFDNEELIDNYSWIKQKDWKAQIECLKQIIIDYQNDIETLADEAMAETDTRIPYVGMEGKVMIIESATALLPFSFGSESMK